MLCRFLGRVRLRRFEQGSYFEIQDAKNPDLFMQLQLNLCVGKLRAHRHNAVVADCLQSATTKPAGVLDQKPAPRCLAIHGRKVRLHKSSIRPNDATRH